jgi:RimJ/RimL family protein N-acetyltransferase
VRIRAARADELPALQDIERAAGQPFADIGMTEIAQDEPYPLPVLAACLQAGLLWVTAGQADQPAAYLMASVVDGSLHVDQVSVHPGSARRGLGRALLEYAAGRAAADGLAALTLTTFAAVPWNAPYYQRCGFRVLGDAELTPGLRAIRRHEAELGLDRWPRTCMRRDLAVRVVHLPAAAFRALAAGDLAAANKVSPVPLTEYFVSPEWRGTWRMRSEQVERDPGSAAWVTGVIWDERAQAAVGRAGYHGPPDESGMVEIGYAVDPACRRRGYARAALEALLQRAAREPRVKVVRVSISPDNTASFALAVQYGFTRVGEQWDDEDGLEIIYERAASRKA